MLRPLVQALVQRALQAFADAETRGLRSRTANRLAGTRVARGASGAVHRHEAAETDESNFLSRLQRLGDAVDERFQRVLCLRLIQARLIGNRRDEFGLGHCLSLPARYLKPRTSRGSARLLRVARLWRAIPPRQTKA